jgi:hypothetical protein
MSIEQTYKCDGCGKKMDLMEAMQHSGNWTGALSGTGVTAFHACSVACGVKHMRANADALEKKAAAAQKAREEAAKAAPAMNEGLGALANLAGPPTIGT